MTGKPHDTPRGFAANSIDAVLWNLDGMSANPDGTPRALTVDQGIAMAQVQALNAIAASLLALVDGLDESRKK